MLSVGLTSSIPNPQQIVKEMRKVEKGISTPILGRTTLNWQFPGTIPF